MDMPLLAYGTWVESKDTASLITDRVRTAIQMGYTHIDTAQNYGTEWYAIQGIQQSGISRSQIFFTSKLTELMDPKQLSLRLGPLQYYDLLLLHFPPMNARSREEFKKKLLPIWIGMNTYLNFGIAKAIGVSNFYQNHLDILLNICNDTGLTPPLVNQIEIHIGNLELTYVPYMQSKGIIPFAHTPLGGLGSHYLLQNEILLSISQRLSASPAQVILAYLLQRGIGVVTTSSNPTHIKDILSAPELIPNFSIQDMQAIDSTESNLGPIVDGSIAAFEHNIFLY